MKQALARYLVETGQEDNWPKHGIETCLEVLPYFQKKAPRWNKVHKGNFHPNSFPAHHAYYDQVCNSLKSKRELKSMVKDELRKLKPEDVTEQGGDTEDEHPEYVFEDDVPTNQEAAKTPEFEKPDEQIDSSTWGHPVDPVNKFLRNATPDASIHSGPILWQNHPDAHSVLKELKEYRDEAMKHQKAYLVCLEKW